MENLLLALDFTTDEQYYNYLVESYLNGQYTQCHTLYEDMPKKNQAAFKAYLDSNVENPIIKKYFAQF